MAKEKITLYFDIDGVAHAYDDTWDVTIHCENEEDHDDVLRICRRLSADKPEDFHEGELGIYQNGDSFEIGKIKSLRDDGAFVYYHTGDTAAKTPYDHLHVLKNAYAIGQTLLGGPGDE